MRNDKKKVNGNGDGGNQWPPDQVKEREDILKMDADGTPGCNRKILHFFYLRSKNPKFSVEERAKNAKCLGTKGPLIDAIQKWNAKLKKSHGFSLDDIHTQPLRHFVHIKDPVVRGNVIMMLKKSVEQKIHPLNGELLAKRGLTENDMLDIIERCGGKPTGVRNLPKLALTPDQLTYLGDVMRKLWSDAGDYIVFKSDPEMRMMAAQILNKLKNR